MEKTSVKFDIKIYLSFSRFYEPNYKWLSFEYLFYDIKNNRQ